MTDYWQLKIAVVGVSSDAGKFGFRIFRDLAAAGYRVAGVNPGGGEILGRKIHRSLAEIDETPALVITVVRPEITEAIVAECCRLGIKEIWMQPGSESPEAVRKAREKGIPVTYNACFMTKEGIW